jgi:hypothetical protein
MKRERLEFHATPVLRRAIDRWRAAQDRMPTRTDAVVELIELGLKAYRATKKAGKRDDETDDV